MSTLDFHYSQNFRKLFCKKFLSFHVFLLLYKKKYKKLVKFLFHTLKKIYRIQNGSCCTDLKIYKGSFPFKSSANTITSTFAMDHDRTLVTLCH